MRIKEVDSRPLWQRDPDLVDEIGHLQNQLRRAIDRNQRAWDLACAVDMVARGCTLEDLRAKIRRPQEVPVLARGTRDFDLDDTQPICLAALEK